MKNLGTCNVQYANNLLKTNQRVLRADRDRNDAPKMNIYVSELTEELLLNISNDLTIEIMDSDSKKGNKSRTDIYFLTSELDNLISILEPFVGALDVKFDTVAQTSPNPTGLEHSEGLQLGKIYSGLGTYINVKCEVHYAENHIQTYTNSKMYIEPEDKRGKKLHLGISMSENICVSVEPINCINIYVGFKDLKKFLHTVKIAKHAL